MAKRSIPDDTIEVKRTEEEDEKKKTTEPAPAQPRRLTTRSATYEGITEDLGPPEEQMNYSVGVTAVLIAAGFSGLGGVSFEKLLKESPSHASLWIRNIQLSIYSLITAFFGGVLYQDGQGIREHGFFEGYNWVVWVLVVLQSCGGLVASLVIRDADNIVKNFATSISIVISFTASMVIFDFTVTWPVSSPFPSLPLSPLISSHAFIY
jgi:UDP-sugar transporter A1/2/3